MFLGIVAAVPARIVRVEPLAQGRPAHHRRPGLDLADVNVGDSIAHNGVCLTVVTRRERLHRGRFARNLDCTVGLDGQANRGEVNLEKAMRSPTASAATGQRPRADGVGRSSDSLPSANPRTGDPRATGPGEVHRTQKAPSP